MKPLQWLGAVLLVLGVAGLYYGEVPWGSERHGVEVGPFAVEVQERETLSIPGWAGAAAALVGGGLLAVGGRRSRRK